LKHWVSKTSKYFLLVIFLGYYISITLFPHIHNVNNINIVHSHPYKTNSDNQPINHQHSEAEFFLIHVLSYFVATSLAIYFSFKIIRIISQKIIIKRDDDFFILKEFCVHLLRAPPLKIHN